MHDGDIAGVATAELRVENAMLFILLPLFVVRVLTKL